MSKSRKPTETGYIVIRENVEAQYVVHDTKEEAVAEARRLCSENTSVFFIYRPVAKVTLKEEPTVVTELLDAR